MPTATIWPPIFITETASAKVSAYPTASKATSAPLSFVSPRITFFRADLLGLTTSSAPSFLAISSRNSFISETITFDAPLSFEACKMKRPIVPAPITTTVSSADIGALLAACVAIDTGSRRADCINDILSGIFETIHHGTATYSANAPCLLKAGTETPNTCRFSQRLYHPLRHGSHLLQYTVESKQTLSLLSKSSTFLPTSSITPAASWPITKGGSLLPVLPVNP